MRFLTHISFISAVYDPDPLLALRRRRMSNDSVDSGGSLDHFSRAERLHPSIQLHQTYTPKKESCLVSPNSTASSLPSPAAKKSSSSSEKSAAGSGGGKGCVRVRKS